jgi:hypothetical protein
MRARCLLILSLSFPAWAQHSGHHPAPTVEVTTTYPSWWGLFQSDMSLMTGMTPHDRMAGMEMPGWSWMVLGVGRIVLNDQGGPSGDRAFESSNWNMVMGHHALGRGRLSLMLMNSLEPATIEDEGSPELFQTGESFGGQPLVDHQHAHDFFMNLSATWRMPFGNDSGLWIQLAPVGDPALGPTAFMHRASSGENPSAPLGHHWQDSTHITSNVITVGGGRGIWAVEGSVFHGAEPDEERWDIDGGEIDSYSGRLTLRFARAWSAQLSLGRLESPEALVPGDLTRTTASVHYGAAGERPFAASLVWGRNDEGHGVSDSFLLEAAYMPTNVDSVFARAEYVEKDEDLLATKELAPEGQPTNVAAIRALTLGYLRDLELFRSLDTGLAFDFTAYGFPAGLDAAYGESPLSAHVFVRLRWKAASAAHAGHSHGA